MLKINCVTVLGANGSMGVNVGGLFASFGGAKVYMVCRTKESAENACKMAALSVRAEVIGRNLIPKTYDDLKECVNQSDLVFESVAENERVKSDILKLVDKVDFDCRRIYATGTSGLSINTLALALSPRLRQNFMGVHFFNPPYNMPLCEVIPSEYTKNDILSEVKEYLVKILRRKVVQVNDAPAFLGNRIGFQFINRAIQYAVKFSDNGGIDYIDSVLGGFTGRNMPPILTADFVGLDVHKAIVDNVYNNVSDYAKKDFILPRFVNSLLEKGHVGRKVNKGFYQTIKNEEGLKTIYVYDIATDSYRPKEFYNFIFAKNMVDCLRVGDYGSAIEKLISNHSLEANICLKFLLNYIVYSVNTAKNIGESVNAADDAMANGFNWIPPLALIDAFGGADKAKELVKEHLEEEIEGLDLESLFNNIPSSNYDYRPFFKAKM